MEGDAISSEVLSYVAMLSVLHVVLFERCVYLAGKCLFEKIYYGRFVGQHLIVKTLFVRRDCKAPVGWFVFYCRSVMYVGHRHSLSS